MAGCLPDVIPAIGSAGLAEWRADVFTAER